MCGSRGFTLLELMVAVAVVAVGFSALFELLGRARLEQAYTRALKEDLFQLSSRIVEGKTEGLEREKRPLKDYPELEEVTYQLGSAQILVYRLRR
ncbi:MAG: prepilin-type N-terminal cleavage/methylation domain-containing protein [Aquificaceae bacterium]|nr:prepilin-type N-terminal cleavage/methylation domain-containing protein [Aquificaceae bacterium]